jgi:crotonobetainyl-CoA:carnitine CoA-transferase CaiB-like acyl-CoA transferase/SAM-dependent methyltransferase
MVLSGIRVVEIGQNLAGPVAGEILAHLGADVVKVERPEGDDARRWGPPFWKGVSPGFLAVNANKRSITVDLKNRDAVTWLVDFVGEADVLVQNLRPGALEELGLGPDALTARHPRLIYCSIWAFGRTGPLRLKPGYEPMVQAFSGLMMMNGDEGGPPTRIGTSILDYGTGMWAALGALAGLVRRAETGRGCIVDTSLFETGLAWLKGHYATFSTSGTVPERHRTGSHRVVPFQSFETKTGPIMIGAGNDRLFAKLARVLDRPQWPTDPRFATNAARVTNKTQLLAEIESLLRTRSKGDWIDRLEAEGVPCAVINSLPAAVGEPQAVSLGMVQPVPGDEFTLMGLPLSFDGVRPAIRLAPPGIGEHTDQVRAAGFGAPPSSTALIQMMTGYYVSHAIYVAAKLGIADLLENGPQPGSALAAATGTHAPSLTRVLRLLASAGVLAEHETGSFGLTPIGERLRARAPGSLRAAALLLAGPLPQRTWSDLSHSVQTGDTAFQHVFGMGAFEYFARHPEDAATFAEAMTALTAPVAAAVVAAYDFSRFGSIVDVGGGHGVLLTAIVKANPGLRGILFDLPHVTEGAKQRFETAGVAGRCDVVAGDFFEAVPAGSDAYLLKHVIHDWDDARSVKILENCRRAMAAPGKLLLVEMVLPPRMDQSAASRMAAGSDVNMLVNTGGRERTEAEYRALFEAARFTLTRIVPTQVLSSVLEAAPRG